jgi:hypothetical protein
MRKPNADNATMASFSRLLPALKCTPYTELACIMNMMFCWINKCNAAGQAL